jgi:hypothetical protein
MYDYSVQPRSKVEAVDHEIHIMGVKLGYFPYLLWGFLIGLFTGGPLVGFLAVGVSVLVCRAFYKAEERGEPLTFDPSLADFLARLPRGIGTRILSSMAGIERARAQYRD